jgi:hypothetical protein
LKIAAWNGCFSIFAIGDDRWNTAAAIAPRLRGARDRDERIAIRTEFAQAGIALAPRAQRLHAHAEIVVARTSAA